MEAFLCFHAVSMLVSLSLSSFIQYEACFFCSSFSVGTMASFSRRDLYVTRLTFRKLNKDFSPSLVPYSFGSPTSFQSINSCNFTLKSPPNFSDLNIEPWSQPLRTDLINDTPATPFTTVCCTKAEDSLGVIFVLLDDDDAWV